MASVEKRPGKKPSWRVTWRDPAGRQRHSEPFTRKGDADRYRSQIDNDLHRGSYVDPGEGKLQTGVWAERWLGTQSHLKPSTAVRYEGIVRKHIIPRFGRIPLARVTHSEVTAWVNELAGVLAPTTIRYMHRVLALMLDAAVKDQRIGRNPAVGVQLPRASRHERRFLTREELAELADACGRDRLFVQLLGNTGLRWGEAAALKVGKVDLLRRRIEVSASVTEVRGKLVWGTPKSHQSRTVPIPKFLVDDLAEHLAGRGPDELAFPTSTGGVRRNLNWRRDVFDRAAASVGLGGFTPHELRHTAASLAISAGASVRSVQVMLGHASPSMTLDVYTHLFDSDWDALMERMDAAQLAAVPAVFPNATVTPITQRHVGG